MKSLYISMICVALASGAWGCKGDPTEYQRNDPMYVRMIPNEMYVGVGKTEYLFVAIQDEQLNIIGTDIFVQTANIYIATVVLDSTRIPVNNGEHIFIVKGIAPGYTTLHVASGALTGDVAVNVRP